MMPRIIVPTGRTTFMMGIILRMMRSAFRSIVSRMAVLSVLIAVMACGVLTPVMIVIPGSVKSSVMPIKC
jgi:hypothetical protein